jgi:hypothetical protein
MAGATYKDGACAAVGSFGFCLADLRRPLCGSLERERERAVLPLRWRRPIIWRWKLLL